MHLQLLIQWAILAGLAAAQTPPGFAPAVQKGLNVAFTDQGKMVSIANGKLLSPEATTGPPAILPLDRAVEPFFLIMLDLDIAVSLTSRITLLHWMAQGLVNAPFSRNLSAEATEQESIIAPYISPNPTPRTGKHRYLILLFTQPPHFQFPKAFDYLDPPRNVILRADFNVTGFAAAAGLGEPVGATYWLEQGMYAFSNGTRGSTGSAIGSTAAPVTTGTGTTATSAPSAFRRTGH